MTGPRDGWTVDPGRPDCRRARGSSMTPHEKRLVLEAERLLDAGVAIEYWLDELEVQYAAIEDFEHVAEMSAAIEFEVERITKSFSRLLPGATP